MMQRIWAGIAATWAVIAIFAVLAFGQPSRPAPTGSVVMTRAANGQLVPATGGAGVHAVTSSSSVAATGGAQAVTYVKTSTGKLIPVTSTASANAVTRSS
jgi:hypothetical protein